MTEYDLIAGVGVTNNRANIAAVSNKTDKAATDIGIVSNIAVTAQATAQQAQVLGTNNAANLVSVSNKADTAYTWAQAGSNLAAAAQASALAQGVGVTNNAAAILSAWATASNAIPTPAGAVQGATAWYNGTNWVVNTNALWLGTNWLFYWSSTNSPARFPCNGE